MRTCAARVALALDRKAFVDILFEGKSDIGGAMLPPPNGVWGLPPEELKTVIGYGDVKKNRDEARKLMEKAGYGPNKRLALKVSTRNLAVYRDPAVILIDQLKEIYIDGELDVVESGIWFAKVARKEYSDRPQPHRRRHRRSGPDLLRELRLRLGAQLHQLLQQGPAGAVRRAVAGDGRAKRKKLVWEIDKKLQEDVARPILYHSRQGTCWAPYVKNVTIMTQLVLQRLPLRGRVDGQVTAPSS